MSYERIICIKCADSGLWEKGKGYKYIEIKMREKASYSIRVKYTLYYFGILIINFVILKSTIMIVVSYCTALPVPSRY